MRFALSFMICAAAFGQANVAIRFHAVVGSEDFACGRQYAGVGTTHSSIAPRDFRFYVHNVRLVDDAGREVPLDLDRDGKWQLGGTALLDFEDATGACRNGTPAMNAEVVGTVPAGSHFQALRFTLGVPETQNHKDLTAIGSPLNLTAMAWVWNAGRRFMRLEFSSTGLPRGYALHLGSTACVNSVCANNNRAEVELKGFDPARDEVVADIAALLAATNVDQQGCESDPDDKACAAIFAKLGLPFAGKPGEAQAFFRVKHP